LLGKEQQHEKTRDERKKTEPGNGAFRFIARKSGGTHASKEVKRQARGRRKNREKA